MFKFKKGDVLCFKDREKMKIVPSISELWGKMEDYLLIFENIHKTENPYKDGIGEILFLIISVDEEKKIVRLQEIFLPPYNEKTGEWEPERINMI